MDKASPADTPPDTPHALSARDYNEGFISKDAAEGVWGYLLPLNSKYGAPIALKSRNTSSNAKAKDSYGTGKTQDADTNLVSSAGRYLIGHHPGEYTCLALF
jgi:serine/threonine-protein kinase Chk2